MDISIEQLEHWMEADSEDEHLEFKEARTTFDKDKLGRYCSALANEGGGWLILGVSDEIPRKVVGSRAFDRPQLQKRCEWLFQALGGVRVDADIVEHPDGPVIVFRIPPHPFRQPVYYKGPPPWMRIGEQLHPMTREEYERILAEGSPDFSAQVCAEASFSDLAPEAIEEFRTRWIEKSANERYGDFEPERLLGAARLVREGGITNAALVLFGTSRALDSWLPQAEVIFEYRSSEDEIHAQERQDYRRGFFSFYDALWEKINARNNIYQVPEGMIRHDIRMFNEEVVREAMLNAVTHRDYSDQRPVFIRQNPRSITFQSPGGLLEPVTIENILHEEKWRNSLIAETFQRCGLVDRSGQGIDVMYDHSIREAKALPDFSSTDAHTVRLTLSGIVEDPEFLKYLEKVRQDQEPLALDDLRVLDAIRRDDQTIVQQLHNRIGGLRDGGFVDVTGRGRGTKYLLSEQYYEFIGQPGAYTRERGLDKKQRKQLLLNHIERHRDEGSPRSDLLEVVPGKSASTVDRMLDELKQEQRIHRRGKTRAARWYPGSAPE